MGKLKITKSGPMASVQDIGRFGYRKYGIPQSGAMDREWMTAVNQMVNNPDAYPVIEFAISGISFEALAETTIAVVGAEVWVNDQAAPQAIKAVKGDQIRVSPPYQVYAYLSIGGLIEAKKDFESFSTYPLAGFGGIDGRYLKAGDEIETLGSPMPNPDYPVVERKTSEVTEIRIMQGPEWASLKELPRLETFQVATSSNRMGIRLEGARLDCDYQEIASSAVVPGTIQLPSDCQPIILMNDCQTTGGYPRIGKVIDEDMGKLAQLKPGKSVRLILETIY